jgi:hypothetical protein
VGPRASLGAFSTRRVCCPCQESKHDTSSLPTCNPAAISITSKSKICLHFSYLPGKSTKEKFNGIGNRLRLFSRHCDERDLRFPFTASLTNTPTHSEAYASLARYILSNSCVGQLFHCRNQHVSQLSPQKVAFYYDILCNRNIVVY